MSTAQEEEGQKRTGTPLPADSVDSTGDKESELDGPVHTVKKSCFGEFGNSGDIGFFEMCDVQL